jgi:hypothetical protein
MSENHFSVIGFENFANMSLNDITICHQREIHTKEAACLKFVEGLASRRGSITLAWNREYLWSDLAPDAQEPWIARHIQLQEVLPFVITY